MPFSIPATGFDLSGQQNNIVEGARAPVKSRPIASRFLTALAKDAPILPGIDQGCYVDIDDTIKAAHGYAKQGAGYGYTGVKD